MRSARYASEIHKRRTGRWLRVTELAVLGEEMYQEEDNNIPARNHSLSTDSQLQRAEHDRLWEEYLRSTIGYTSPSHVMPQDAGSQKQWPGARPEKHVNSSDLQVQHYVSKPYNTSPQTTKPSAIWSAGLYPSELIATPRRLLAHQWPYQSPISDSAAISQEDDTQQSAV